MKTYEGMEEYLHVFLISALDVGEVERGRCRREDII
jgi:hypothetical protein